MKKKAWAKHIPLLAVCAAAGVLIAFSPQVKTGIAAGLQLCGETLIPSLFLFFCLCHLALAYCRQPPRLLARCYTKLFHLPANTAMLFLLSLAGGYPMGALMCARAVDSGRLPQQQARRLSLFACAAGPAFCILAVGEGMCHSKSIGVFLYLSNVLAQVLLGCAIGLRYRKEPICKADNLYAENKAFSAAFCEAVEQSISAMLSVCAYVLLFSVLLQLFSLLPLPQSLVRGIGALLEVTTGCAAFADRVPALAFIIGFGGFSVFFLIKKYLQIAGTKASAFLLFRLISGALGYGIFRLLLWCFPQSVATLAAGVQVQAFSVSAPLSAVLVMSFAAFILDNKKGKLFQ